MSEDSAKNAPQPDGGLGPGRGPEQPNNHWPDGVVGCAVAASIQGCILFRTDERDRRLRERVRLSCLQRSRR